MYDISIFIKELKGRFAQWYNRRHGRYGVLWAERFKSLLIEGGEALAAVAAYIELNPVRAGLCADPKIIVIAAKERVPALTGEHLRNHSFNRRVLAEVRCCFVGGDDGSWFGLERLKQII